MAALERDLDVVLLRRTPHGTGLTEAGILVVEWAAPLLDAAERFSSTTRALRAAPATNLRIASSMTIAEHLAPAWIIALRAADRAARIELIAANSTAVVESVRAGNADIGFIETPELPEGLERMTFATDELVVVVGPGHPWARRSSGITVDELASTPVLARERGSGTRLAFERALTAAGHKPADPAIELSTAGAIRSTAAAGQTPAVLSILAVRDQIADRSLRRVTLRGLRIVRPLTAIWRADGGRQPRAVEELLSIISRA
jgi:DNA-binding transcriptional LysR family regulator